MTAAEYNVRRPVAIIVKGKKRAKKKKKNTEKSVEIFATGFWKRYNYYWFFFFFIDTDFTLLKALPCSIYTYVVYILHRVYALFG